MKFMGDYMSKGKSEKELALTILKVYGISIAIVGCIHLSIDSA